MKTTEIYVVQAFGGQYEDAWEQNVCAFQTDEEAVDFVIKLEYWIKTIREEELPEALQDYNWDLEDDEQISMYQIGLDEYYNQVLIDMGVPEEFIDFVLLHQVEPMHEHQETHFAVESLVLVLPGRSETPQ